LAEIVLGIGTSHTPQMSSTAQLWTDHGVRDRNNPKLLAHDGEYHHFDDLLATADPAIASQLTEEIWNTKYDRAQECVEILAAELAAARPDVVVIVGDDQEELFEDGGTPAIGLFTGDVVFDRPPEGARHERLAQYPGLLAAQWASHGTGSSAHKVESGLAMHLAEHLTLSEFDLTLMANQADNRSIGHAFTFARYRLHMAESVPMVPVLLNTYFQPNVPSAARCYDLGRAIRAGILSWPSDARVAILASGGLSHFVVLPEWDNMVLDAMAPHDRAALTAIPRRYFRSGTSETLNWITVAGAFETGTMQLVDYIPGYRTPAGTGTGMAFATWKP
jgi:hypothetical protein